jgi:hypothetical protein
MPPMKTKTSRSSWQSRRAWVGAGTTNHEKGD